MMLDEEEVGIIGADSLIFLYMTLIKSKKAPSPLDLKQFLSGYSNLIQSLPSIDG